MDVIDHEKNKIGVNPDFREKDIVFSAHFWTDVASLNFSSLATALPGRDISKDIPDYSFIPVISDGPIERSLDTAWNPHVPYSKTYDDHFFTLGASLAIGLAYKDSLSAVAAAGLSFEDDQLRLKIVQIQGVENLRISDREGNRKSGLNRGLNWRETLIKAWIEIAKLQGIHEIELLSAENVDGKTDDNIERLKKSYDLLAQSMGFTRDPTTTNWFLRLVS